MVFNPSALIVCDPTPSKGENAWFVCCSSTVGHASGFNWTARTTVPPLPLSTNMSTILIYHCRTPGLIFCIMVFNPSALIVCDPTPSKGENAWFVCCSSTVCHTRCFAIVNYSSFNWTPMTAVPPLPLSTNMSTILIHHCRTPRLIICTRRINPGTLVVHCSFPFKGENTWFVCCSSTVSHANRFAIFSVISNAWLTTIERCWIVALPCSCFLPSNRIYRPGIPRSPVTIHWKDCYIIGRSDTILATIFRCWIVAWPCSCHFPGTRINCPGVPRSPVTIHSKGCFLSVRSNTILRWWIVAWSGPCHYPSSRI